jgi:hypothetical protein
MTQTNEKVAPAATETTRRMNPASFTRFNMTRKNRVIAYILDHIEATRHPLVLLCVLGGYGFASAGNFVPAFVCAGLGLVLSEGPEVFYRWLHHVQAAEDAALAGHEPDGHYVGDGVPRDQGGHEYEPLSWGALIRI